MHSFGSQLLRAHYQATGWNNENEYAQLTGPTRALLDLGFIPGLHFSLGKLPVPHFANSASLSVLSPPSEISSDQVSPVYYLPSPTLTGSISYFASGIPSLYISPTRLKALTSVVDRFSVPLPPSTGTRHTTVFGIDPGNNYLLYGRFHLPSYRLDGLYTKRLSENLQGLITLVSVPSSNQIHNNSSNQDHSQPITGSSSIWNLMMSLSHDTGRCSQQYSYSSEDGLFGFKVLYNFPPSTTGKRLSKNFQQHQQINLNGSNENQTLVDREKLVDEEEAMDNVLKGRFSVGGELYFSAQKRSAGVSTGVRFCTIPEPAGSVTKTQQPTVITATLNPIMGQISTCYATKLGNNLSLATRFDFNIFSFESDITFGGEWLQKLRTDKRISTDHPKRLSKMKGQIFEKSITGDKVKDCQEAVARGKRSVSRGPEDNDGLVTSFWESVFGKSTDLLGILRARFSPVTGFTLMWEGRWKECLIGLGINSKFLISTSTNSPENTRDENSHIQEGKLLQPVIKGVCFELQYNTDG
ncbi:hypothetical protein BY996DRAFT_4587351 [Phakopsora pachyrhizi]|uniref:Mitochondrial distribution and morphology protein 10 n=1 Tax=Phakopsora pachyrhizi TaxID=170000 RepID=A0AAV0BGR6_PHAPC|nr:hypothetical protein BY996DRAFT_4587351 [Phakopsora pachyrhizi]CAH7685266.1 hypothetical protein PPACK8108_LOCUS19757 [Phakopsora pachyrhizi]